MCLSSNNTGYFEIIIMIMIINIILKIIVIIIKVAFTYAI